MPRFIRLENGAVRAIALAASSAAFLLGTPAHAAACRATDFTDQPLSSWEEVQRLSFVTEMTRTEYERLKAEPEGSPDHLALISNSSGISEARQAARAKLESLNVENIDQYRKLWSSNFLDDEGLREFADCESGRQPGLATYGRFEAPGLFHLTYVHITPIGIEQITTRVVASKNIANIADFEASLEELGPQDNYVARTFPLTLEDPEKPAVLVMRAGWETPLFTYVPVNPTPDYFKSATETKGN